MPKREKSGLGNVNGFFLAKTTQALFTALFATLVFHSSSARAQSAGAHLTPAGSVRAPDGAANLCTRYGWACRGGGDTRLNSAEILSLARDINLRVNRRVRAVDDQAQYRRAEHWALPTRRGGDCEDFALLKKKELLAKGVSADRLLIATVFIRGLGAHAVLVLRLDTGDMILDNVTNVIKPWQETPYTFMRMQNPERPDGWVLVSARR